MAELMQAVVSWPTLLLAIAVFSLAPDVVLRLFLLLYPSDHPRRAELIAELKIVPRHERPFWVAEQLCMIVCEGVPLRAGQLRERLRSLARRRQQVVIQVEGESDAELVERLFVGQAKRIDLRPLGADRSGPMKHFFIGTPGEKLTIVILDADLTRRRRLPNEGD